MPPRPSAPSKPTSRACESAGAASCWTTRYIVANLNYSLVTLLAVTATGDPYATLGNSYATRRRPDPRVAREIWAALGDARTVLNVGAGAGSYEPPGRRVLAVEPSPVMIAQRPAGAAPVIQGRAERLPFPAQAFEVALAILTVHHWASPADGLAELGCQ